MLCSYGCNQTAKYKFKNGKLCCSRNHQRCPENKKKHLGKNNFMFGKIGKENPNFGRKHTDEAIEKIRNTHKEKVVSLDTRKKLSKVMKGKIISEQHRRKISIANKGHIVSEETKIKISNSNKGKTRSKKIIEKISTSKTYKIKDYKLYHPLFSKIEEMRYNPNKPREKEIQIHCKNHKCKNSKEKRGWFTPSKSQLYERIRGIELTGNDGSYFYCSKQCKNECPLFKLQADPYKTSPSNYTSEEHQTFRKLVLERDEYICQYCGEQATDVHHERPQKTEPFFALDPDFAWSVCKKCHYEYGHKDDCSTGKLSSLICL